MYEQLFEYNSEYHTVVALMNARDKKEFDTKFTEIVNPKVEIKRLNPTISFSSTELREALEGTGHPEALLFLPYVNYRKIVDNDWYRKLNN